MSHSSLQVDYGGPDKETWKKKEREEMSLQLGGKQMKNSKKHEVFERQEWQFGSAPYFNYFMEVRPARWWETTMTNSLLKNTNSGIMHPSEIASV